MSSKFKQSESALILHSLASMNRHDRIQGQANDLRDVIKLQRQLRAGLDPATIGKKLGQGVQKAAYLVGRWAVKECTGGITYNDKPESAVAPIDLWRRGMGRPMTFTATCKASGVVWSIQELVTPAADLSREDAKGIQDKRNNIELAGYSCGKCYDTHGKNVGLTKDKRLVAFDW